MSQRVKGQFVRSGVGAGGAYSEMYLEGAKAEEVAEMFTAAPFDWFFGTASTRDRQVHAGGQTAKENPMGAVTGHMDLMETTIRETGRDARGVDIGSSFSGFLNGGARLRIEQEADGVRVTEQGTRVRPDFTKVPVAGAVQAAFEAHVPVAGAMARAMREAGEGVMGTVFEGVHALMAARSPERMAQSIQQRRKTGRW